MKKQERLGLYTRENLPTRLAGECYNETGFLPLSGQFRKTKSKSVGAVRCQIPPAPRG